MQVKRRAAIDAPDTAATVRCKCGYWLGEATEPLVRIEVVPRGPDVTVDSPRDLRYCKQCLSVNVFVPRKEFDRRRDTALDS